MAVDHDHSHCVNAALQAAEAICHEHGQRLTALRRRVLELVWANHRPVGAYTLLEMMRNESGQVAPATVYRALDFLQEQGLVHRLASLNAFIGCAFPGASHAGQFLICTSCQELAELDDGKVTEALSASASASGFAISHTTVEVLGLCPNCREPQP
ncbi:MAG: transcriptional repressor [Desulfobulbaceae bacterium]|nr:transcriptional repressor [Desulfobulbaceae bacterium]